MILSNSPNAKLDVPAKNNPRINDFFGPKRGIIYRPKIIPENMLKNPSKLKRIPIMDTLMPFSRAIGVNNEERMDTSISKIDAEQTKANKIHNCCEENRFRRNELLTLLFKFEFVMRSVTE